MLKSGGSSVTQSSAGPHRSFLTDHMKPFRAFAFHVLRAIGVFALARRLTRRQLRILCYHGFSIGDEYKVAPAMFMRAKTFERRMRILEKLRIPVISLEEAVLRLKRGAIDSAETVITMDDGWASNLSIALPILEKHRYPACIYATTEHLTAGTEVFNVALGYMVRRSGRESLALQGLHPELDGTYHFGKDPEEAIRALIIAAERAFPLAERQKLIHPIARALGLDPAEVLNDGRFRLLTREEFRELSRRGVDIQLHTHRHQLPDGDFKKMADEINKNSDELRALVGKTPRHFCYPSGEYSEQHPEWLSKLGILSATTCDPGLNGATTSVMRMKRFLDSDETSDIDFEAEICGVREMLRHTRSRAAKVMKFGSL